MPDEHRHVALIREWKLIRHLSENPSGCDVAELCRVLNTPYRTIYRDLEALRRAGFPVTNHREGRTSTWTIGPWWRDDFRCAGPEDRQP